MRRLPALLLSICFFLTSYSQPLDIAKLDSLLSVLGSRNLATGSVAISLNGKIKYQRAIGFASLDAEKRIPADVNTAYRIGSATKMFTAVMVFQLVDERKILLAQSLDAFFPELPDAGNITIRDMLYHRSGLHDYTRDTDFENWMDQPKTQEALLALIREKGTDFKPGEKADYSNTNYLVLGYIIEKVCKMPYAEALKSRIISRLRLKHTYYGRAIDANEANSYKYVEGNWNKQRATSPTLHSGAGSIVSTATDLVTFLDALFACRLVSCKSLEQMKSLNDGYGMGLFPDKYGSRRSFGHNGRIEEFYTAAWHFPDNKLSLTYCTNGINYPRTDIIEGILKICFGEQYQVPFTQTINLKDTDLDKYLGEYTAPQMGIVVHCKKDKGKLSVETQGKAFEVVPIAPNYFQHAAAGYYFEFFPGNGELLIKETDNIYLLKRAE